MAWVEGGTIGEPDLSSRRKVQTNRPPAGEVRLGFKSGGLAVPPVCLGLATCGHRTIVLNRKLETTAGGSRNALCCRSSRCECMRMKARAIYACVAEITL